jgi:hypothetical protein
VDVAVVGVGHKRRGDDWDRTCRRLERLDPHAVFGNPLLDRLMRRT